MRALSTVAIVVISVVVITTSAAYGCSCASGNSVLGKSAWDVAKMRADSAVAIFEGTPERLDFRWIVLEAKPGDLIPADTSYATGTPYPHMTVRFRVQRVYKSKIGQEVEVTTGWGGGDCGARFTSGFTYLVYLYPSKAGEFAVSMCSPGGPTNNSELSPALRYLRGEQPIRSDLMPYRPQTTWTAKDLATDEARRKRRYEAYQEEVAKTTGKICGTIIPTGRNAGNVGVVSFLSTLGYSPGGRPYAVVSEDGSFCSGPLGPGKYYLHFSVFSNERLQTSLYYPDVSDREKATYVDVIAGQTRSNVRFTVSSQKTYSVYGFLSTNDKSGLGANDVSVELFRVDGIPLVDSYRTPVDFKGAFPLPRVKLFNFEEVLPGRYVAYVSGLGPGWFTKKMEFTVSSHSRFVFLELVHQKQPQ